MSRPDFKNGVAWLLGFVILVPALLLPVRGDEKQPEKEHWTYSGKTGPEYWHTLNPNWAIAKVGKKQSPINLTKAKEVKFPAPKITYEETPLAVIHNNGDSTELLVLGVFLKPGAPNPLLQKIWDLMPKMEGKSKETDIRFNPKELLPKGSYHLYRYDGSLTVPPCTENVRWYVYSTPIEVSIPQIKAFQGLFPTNARPVQPAYDRPVEVSGPFGG